MRFFRHIVARETVKFLLARTLRWQPTAHPRDGYSIIISVPWDLKHLLPVNLKFVSKTDLSNLHVIHIVFDRTERPGAEKLIEDVKQEFPELPLRFRFLEPISGKIICSVGISAFYHATCAIMGLKDCATRYAILHDFDLFPVVENYFEAIYETLKNHRMRFVGVERTHFDGLADDDNIQGTWGLGVDAAWLREHHRPVACYHRTKKLGDRIIHLDPFSELQTQTPERMLAEGLAAPAFCHAMNLCSTYLCFVQGKRPHFAWRLHYLWYLEHLAGNSELLIQATEAMLTANSPILRVGNYATAFDDVHWTCANVLRDEVTRLEHTAYGTCRPIVREFLVATDRFMKTYAQDGPDAPKPNEAANDCVTNVGEKTE